MKLMRTKPNSIELILFVILLFQAQAQRPGFKLKEWQENRFWFWSSEAPITKALDKFPEVVQEAEKTLEHLERVEAAILSEIRNRTIPTEATFLHACGSRDTERWPKQVFLNFGVRGLPDPDLSCITDFHGVQFTQSEPAPYSVKDLYDVIHRFGVHIQQHARSVIAPIINVENNFTGPSYAFNFPYNTPRAQCVLHPLNAIRVGEKWRVTPIIQNRPVNEFLPLDGRQILVEFFRVVDGHLGDNVRMRLPVRPKNGTEREIRDDATTILISSRGNATPATFRNIPIEENPAIVEALDRASVSFDQAQSAVTPSNISILVLPLFLNLLPVAAFSDVNGIQMIFLVILGDVLTIIPLLIKGIELLLIRETHNVSVVTRMSSSIKGNLSEAAAAEIFAADCQAHDEVRTVGVIYISLSIAFLIIGITLEIAAKRYRVYRRKHLLMRLMWSANDSSMSGDTDEESLMYSSPLDSDDKVDALYKVGCDRSISDASYSKALWDDDSSISSSKSPKNIQSSFGPV